MVDCLSILKSKLFFGGASRGKKGMSITELLIVITIIAVLMVVFIAAFKPWTQQAKARDSRRKSDLQKLKNPLEDYYNDNNCYPPDLQTLADEDYIGEEPKDPDTGELYEYYRQDDDCDRYWIYVKLEWQQDSEIVEVGCDAGCGPEGDAQTDPALECAFNYGVSSPGESLECCIAPCPGMSDVNIGCQSWADDDLREHCGGPGCCPGSGWILTCPPGIRPYCCPKEE
jgi:prepilin-type N-terminal cleavage/methylation domain-containing protein